ncbi:MAG: thioesterase [Moraxellaceae bacterium]|nr:MAG: thioesterase [Moraxellaceae bacterium]PCJ18630.1 MAG: thioesterase [Gammaproteobacteria bacterium]
MEASRDYFAAVREEKNYQKAIELVPYAKLLGISFSESEKEGLLFHLPFDQKNIGNTMLPAIHGGVIAGFMENAAVIHLMWAMESVSMPKIIDFNIDYTLSGRPEDTYASCNIVKLGKRIANVQIEAWQSNRDKVIAVARSHFKLIIE